jgi:hypothetical protein
VNVTIFKMYSHWIYKTISIGKLDIKGTVKPPNSNHLSTATLFRNTVFQIDSLRLPLNNQQQSTIQQFRGTDVVVVHMF